MDQKILTAIDSFTKNNQEAIFRDIGRLVSVNSVESAPEENAPFGKGAKEVLDLALGIASELGLETCSCANKIGYASVGGNGDRYLATITHLDVVPAGDGWKADPFTMREREGYILGRGVIDDKGPSVLCLYALKFLKESGISLRYPVRALLGANEETGMADVEYYLANYEPPLFCFSPDAEFPLICGEKGIWHGTMTSICSPENVLQLRGGVAPNAIPGKCEATVKASGLADTEEVKVKDNGDGTWNLVASGIAGHASIPAGTRNAIGVMIDYLLSNKIVCGAEEDFFRLASMGHLAYDGSMLGIFAESEGFTPLTVVHGMIGIKDGHFEQSIDIRYVPSVTGEWVLEGLKKAAGDKAVITQLRDAVPFYKAPDSPDIKACMDAYNLITGENCVPFTIGGGTYARDFPNAVGFGPEHNERPMPDFCGTMHGAEEAASKQDLLEALKIYIVSLLNLEALDF